MVGAPAGARNGDAGVDPTPGVVLPPPAVLAPKVKPELGAEAGGAGAGDPNRNPPPVPAVFVVVLAEDAGAPKVKVVGEAAAAPAGAAEVVGVPNVNDEGAGLEAAAGVAEPNVKLGIEAPAAAGVVFCGESSIISPPPLVAVAVAAEGLPKPPKPPPLLLPVAVLPKAALDEGVPNENPAALDAGLASVEGAAVGAPNTPVPFGVVAPEPGADAVGEAVSPFEAPNENVGAGFDSGPGLLPNVKPPALDAGFAASAVLATPKENPVDAGAPEGVGAPKPPMLSDAGLPNEKLPATGAAGLLGLLGSPSPLAPKKLGTLGLAAVGSSFFSVVIEGAAPKLKLPDCSVGLGAVAGEPNVKLGVLFFVAGSSSTSAPRFEPTLEEGVPKLNPLAPDGLGAEPKKEALPVDAGAAASCCFSVLSVEDLAPKEPKGLLLADAGGSEESVAGLAAPPKLNVGLFAAAVALAADSPLDGGAPKVNPPVDAAVGVLVDWVSNFFMVVPKKLGTGPSFLPSVSDLDSVGSTGLLKKSEAGVAVGFLAVLSSLGSVVGAAALSPKLNLCAVEGVSLEGAGNENDGSAVGFFGVSIFPEAAEESKAPNRLSKEPPEVDELEFVSAAVAFLVSALGAASELLAGAAAELLPKEKPEGNILVGSFILARSLASGSSSSSSSSSHALNLPEL